MDVLPADWINLIGAEFQKPYMRALDQFLSEEQRAGQTVYPDTRNIFQALACTPFNQVKVVILGQDPYHGPHQAHGLAFSVREGIKPPPSLVNIYKEIERDFGKPVSRRGDLTGWAIQGVLLLNTTLTVRAGQAGSHQKRGWEIFTDAVIEKINQGKTRVVFMLWGSHAQKKGAVIGQSKHLVLEAPHPSPLSAYRGFIGCGHFSLANDYLIRNGQQPIDWLQ